MALSRVDHGLHLFPNTGSFTAQGTGPFSTGSFTPADNSLLVAAVMCGTNTAANSDTNFITTGGGWTWTKRVNRTITFNTDGFIHQIWTAPVATGASMTVTSTHTGETSYAYGIAVYAYTGYNTSSPVGGTASGDATGTSQSLTLSAAPASDSDVLAFINITAANSTASDASASSGSSFTELFETNTEGSFEKWSAQARTGSVSDAVSWTTASSASSPFDRRIYSAIEIKAAAANAVGNGLTAGLKLQRVKLAA
jgi:hypothetical protein